MKAKKIVLYGVALLGAVGLCGCENAISNPDSIEEGPDLQSVVSWNSYKFLNIPTTILLQRYPETLPSGGTNLTSAWRNALDDAVDAWNAVSGARLQFGYASGPVGGDILIYHDNNIGSACAKAEWPEDGNVGWRIRVDPDDSRTTSYADKVWVMAHELAHTVAIGHTNYHTWVDGTKAQDAASVFNSGCGEAWNGFSTNDQYLIRLLFPNLPSVGTPYNSGGHPRFSWPVVSGVSRFQVKYFVNDSLTATHPIQSSRYFTDSDVSYTGDTSCNNYYEVAPVFWVDGGYHAAYDSKKVAAPTCGSSGGSLTVNIHGHNHAKPYGHCHYWASVSPSGSYSYTWKKNGSTIGSGSSVVVYTTSPGFDLSVIVSGGGKQGEREIGVVVNANGTDCDLH